MCWCMYQVQAVACIDACFEACIAACMVWRFKLKGLPASPRLAAQCANLEGCRARVTYIVAFADLSSMILVKVSFVKPI